MALPTLTAAGAEALSAGIGFLGNLGGSVSGGLFGANQARKNRKFQERMYNKQVEDNLNFWNMQNEYNLPSAQLERLRQAGLSGLLMYGEGGISGNLAQQAPNSAQAPHGAQAQASSFNTAINMENLALLMAQKKNLESDSALKTSQALTETERAIREREEAGKARSESFFNMVSWRERLTEINRKNELAKTQSMLNEELQKTEPEKRRTLIAEQHELSKRCDVIDAQIKDYESQIDSRERITQAQIDKMNAEIDVMVQKAAHEMALMDAEARKLAADAFIMEIEGAIHSMPEWQASYLNKFIGESKEALYRGHEQEVTAIFKKYLWDTMPKYDESSYSYRKWLKNYAEPATKAFGQLLGGSGAATISLLK